MGAQPTWRVSGRHNILLRRLLTHILPADGGRDQVGESIGCAGNAGMPSRFSQSHRFDAPQITAMR